MEKRKPIAAIIFDVHLKPKTSSTVYNCCSEVIEICKERSIDKVFIGGDWFTSREAQPLSTLIDADRIFSEFKTAQISIHAIAGNHDKTSLDSNESYLDIFSDHTHFDVVTDDSYYLDCDKVRVHFIPYFKEKTKYPKILEKVVSNDLHPKKKNILITHIAVNGVRNNDGSEVESGIKGSKFSKFDKVLVGHYHDAQKIGSNIYYCGSLYQNNFGEEDSNKGVTILYDSGEIEQVTVDFPKFVNLKIDVSKLKTVKTAAKQILDMYNEVRVREKDRKRITITCSDKLKESLASHLPTKLDRSCYIIKAQSSQVSEEENISTDVVVFDKERISNEFDVYSKTSDDSRKVIKKCKEYL